MISLREGADARLAGVIQRAIVSNTVSYAAQRKLVTGIQFDAQDFTGVRVLHHISIAAKRGNFIALLGRVHTCLHWE
jgi:hypothetical protein